MIYKLLIVVHLLGLILLGGSTLFSFISFQNLAKKSGTDRSLYENTLAMAKMGFGIGVAFLLLSGLGLIISSTAFAAQIWFRLKMITVILIIINHIIIGRPAMNKFMSPTKEVDQMAAKKLKLFYSLQFALMITVIVLAVFKYA